MSKQLMRDIVVLIPGITGSVLQKDGKDIWAISGQAVWEAFRSLGNSLQQLKLDGDDPEAESLGDGIKATRVVADTHLIPGLVKIDGYTATSRLITDNFQVTCGNIYEDPDDKPANFYKFPYDWRRDCRANAQLLKRLLEQRLKLWREYTGLKEAKVILLAHSMGGLISRYYLEVLDGWQDCKALFTFGTPYRGSVNAVNFLANGYKKQFLDLTEVMRSFTSVYQLLPIYKMLKVNSQYQRIAETDDLHNIVKERAKDALAFHREIEDAVKKHENDENYRKFYKTIPIVGIQQPTLQSAELVNGQLAVNSNLPKWIDPRLSDGDGTVPYLSAIPIELSEEYRDTYVAERHSSIQNHSQVLNELRSRIKAMQIGGLGNIRGPEISSDVTEQVAISLNIDDLYLTDEPVEIRARVVNFNHNFGGLKAQIVPISRNRATLNVDFQEQNQEWILTIGDLAPGLYRLKVQTVKSGSQAPAPIHDLFEVVR